MKKARTFIIIGLIVFAWGCNKDDAPPTPKPDTVDKPDPEPEPENQAPGAFTLLSVKDKDTAVTLLPTFRWNTSTDPDGDMVGYDLLVGKDENTLDTVATDLNTATHTINDRLSLFTEYSWKVTAKDGKGEEASSDVFSFVTRRLNNPTSAIDPPAQFSPRMLHTVTFFNDKLWLYGGQNENGILVDVWSSDDGITWTDYQDPGFGPLRGHAAVSFQETLWFLGGRTTIDKNSRTNKIIPTIGYDENGSVYNADWSARELHTAEVFQDKVWVLGGVGPNDEYFDEVWSSENMTDWKEEAALPSGRFGHTSVVFDDKLWVIGGSDGENYLNDIWYTDGSTWTKAPKAPFLPRVSHVTVVYDNKIWVYGGNDLSRAFGDIWYSENGQDWTRFALEGNYEGRVRPTLTVFNDQILLIGGSHGGTDYLNDIWVFD